MKYVVKLNDGYFSRNHMWQTVTINEATRIDEKKEARRIASRMSSGKYRYKTEVEPVDE